MRIALRFRFFTSTDFTSTDFQEMLSIVNSVQEIGTLELEIQGKDPRISEPQPNHPRSVRRSLRQPTCFGGGWHIDTLGHPCAEIESHAKKLVLGITWCDFLSSPCYSDLCLRCDCLCQATKNPMSWKVWDVSSPQPANSI